MISALKPCKDINNSLAKTWSLTIPITSSTFGSESKSRFMSSKDFGIWPQPLDQESRQISMLQISVKKKGCLWNLTPPFVYQQTPCKNRSGIVAICSSFSCFLGEVLWQLNQKMYPVHHYACLISSFWVFYLPPAWDSLSTWATLIPLKLPKVCGKPLENQQHNNTTIHLKTLQICVQ